MAALLGLALILSPAVAMAAKTAPPAAPASAPAAATVAPKLAPCAEEGLPQDALCARYPVWEDRLTKAGRKIELRVVVLPAFGPKPAPDPVFVFAGGPGAAASDSAGEYADPASKLRQKRAIVFVDQRGTGGSNLLQCKTPGSPDRLQGYFEPALSAEVAGHCRQELEKENNLKRYTTSIAMDDVDEVRQWLGYDKINLEGGSYGTRAVQVFMKRHPQHVRTAVLYGTAAFAQHLPLFHARDEHRALGLVLDDCLADPACKAAFPNVKQELVEVLARLDREPATAVVSGAGSTQPTTVRISRGSFAEEIRFTLYNASTAVFTPYLIHRAFLNDFVPLARVALAWEPNFRQALAFGMHLSVTCAEDIPFIRADQVATAVADTELGDYRLQQQLAACGQWRRAEIPPDFHQPVRADIPTLLFSGRLDPVTPPSWAEQASRFLPNRLHVLLEQGHHGGGGLSHPECLEQIQSDFVDRGSVEGVDIACAATMKRGAWATEAAAFDAFLTERQQ